MLLYISPLLLSVPLGLFLIFFIARKRHVAGVPALMALFLAATWWSAGYAFELLAPNLAEKLFWAKFQYLGITALPLAWFFFAYNYLGSPNWMVRPRRLLGILAMIPLVSLVLVWTNEEHFLFWLRVWLQPFGSLQLLSIEHGPFFSVYQFYSYLLLLFGSIWLVGRLLSSVRFQRWQVALAIFAVLIPWIANLTYISPWNPIPFLDLTPFAFIISGLLFAVSLLHYHLINIVPIAQQSVLERLADCIIILDATDRIVDLNPAAQGMLLPGVQPVGKLLQSVMPEVADRIQLASADKEPWTEVHREFSSGDRYYDLRCLPFTGPYPKPVGRLVVCHEITTLKHEQMNLEHARSMLEKIVSERTEDLRQTVDQLQNELIERMSAEKRFEEVIEAAPDALVVVDQNGTVMLANAQAEQLFGFCKAELQGQDYRMLIPDLQRPLVETFINQFLAHPTAQQSDPALNLVARRKDGEEMPIEISLGPLNTASGVWVACIVRDVRERRQAEQARSQLIEEIGRSREELRTLATRLQEAQEIQSRQTAAVLHDQIGQTLTGLNLELQLLLNQVENGQAEQIESRLQGALTLVEETIQQVRNVMADLQPPVLDQYGLLSALEWYGERFSKRTGISVQVTGDRQQPRLPAPVETTLFRIAQEALHNVTKHAGATSLHIRLDFSLKDAVLEIEDNGRGFDSESVLSQAGQPHWGLISMQQRAESIGGTFCIETSPGQGTLLTVKVSRNCDDH